MPFPSTPCVQLTTHRLYVTPQGSLVFHFIEFKLQLWLNKKGNSNKTYIWWWQWWLQRRWWWWWWWWWWCCCCFCCCFCCCYCCNMNTEQPVEEGHSQHGQVLMTFIAPQYGLLPQQGLEWQGSLGSVWGVTWRNVIADSKTLYIPLLQQWELVYSDSLDKTSSLKTRLFMFPHHINSNLCIVALINIIGTCL